MTGLMGYDRERLCLVGCFRIGEYSGLCAKHRDREDVEDPLRELQVPAGMVPNWKALAVGRNQQLEWERSGRWMRRRTRMRVSAAAAAERSWIFGLVLPHAVQEVLTHLQSQGLEPWRLPGDYTLYRELCALGLFDRGSGLDAGRALHPLEDRAVQSVLGTPADHPFLRAAATAAEAVNWIARALMEDWDPTPPPFLPRTRPRTLNVDHQRVLEEQETRNLSGLAKHGQALHHRKHQSGPLSALDPVFADVSVDHAIAPGVVLFHQIGTPQKIENSSDRIVAATLDRHLQLRPGDVVRYRHYRSATVNTRWHGGLGSKVPAWLNDEGSVENAVRLELAPRNGIYCGSGVCEAINSHLANEREVILPAGLWRVAGVRDTIQPDIPEEDQRGGYWVRSSRFGERLRTILMFEIEESSVSPSTTIIEMTQETPQARPSLIAGD